MLPPRYDTQAVIISHRLNEQWALAEKLQLGAAATGSPAPDATSSRRSRLEADLGRIVALLSHRPQPPRPTLMRPDCHSIFPTAVLQSGRPSNAGPAARSRGAAKPAAEELLFLVETGPRSSGALSAASQAQVRSHR